MFVKGMIKKTVKLTWYISELFYAWKGGLQSWLHKQLIHVLLKQTDYYYASVGGAPKGSRRVHRYYIAYGLGLDTRSFPYALRVAPEVVKIVL